MTDGTYIVVFPEYEQLKAEIARLRTEVSMLVFSLDELKTVRCRNILAAYQMAFGALELRLLDVKTRYLRLRREAQEIRARLNAGKTPDVGEIEKKLDAEFSDYVERRRKKLREMNEAIEYSRRPVMAKTDAAELKKLYRKAVKALHPDLNPGQTPEEASLFLKAVAAFENGDLRMMKTVCSLIGAEKPVFAETDSLTSLRAERDRLFAMLGDVKAEISAVKGRYPYTLRAFVEEKEEGEKLRTALERQIENYAAAGDAMEKAILEMIGNV